MIPSTRKCWLVLACAGMGVDDPDNMIGLPKDGANAGARTGRYFGRSQHNTQHPMYDRAIKSTLDRVGAIKSCASRKLALRGMQETLRSALRRSDNPIVNGQGASQSAWNDILSKF
ncbi:AHH domain-containing protein [Burkholderia paludis]|uniref:AHH domain-containing protein n=1 Tax=Burkholderia paludis TaxID=1506587 RepID=UPI003464D820